MKELPFFSSEQEKILGILGKTQLDKALAGEKLKTSYLVLSQFKLYWGGYYFFQNYVGDWSNHAQQCEPLENITKISYQRRIEPTRTRHLVCSLSIFSLVLAIILAFIYTRTAGILVFVYWTLALAISLAVSIFIAMKARKNIMLDIEFGCEKLSIKTSWFDKGELDYFYNALIQAITVVHKQENVISDAYIGETYAGKKIIAEFGGEYRKEYLRDKKASGGFSVITPDEVYIGGHYSKRIIPGFWLATKKVRTIHTSDIEEITYRTVTNYLVALLVYIFIAAILIFTADPYVSYFVSVIQIFCASMIPVIPMIVNVVCRQSRLIIKSRAGTFSFWTHQYKKSEIRYFQKVLIYLTDASGTGTKIVDNTAHPVMEVQNQLGDSSGISLKEGPELLKEYYRLLQEGIIDQSEFDRIKAEVLSKHR